VKKLSWFVSSFILTIVVCVMTATTASGQALGYSCGKKGDNVPNRCRFEVEGKVKEGVSTCRLDKSDPKVGWYTDCAGGKEQQVTVVGDTYACCALRTDCDPQKPMPAYVAACFQPSRSKLHGEPSPKPSKSATEPKAQPAKQTPPNN